MAVVGVDEAGKGPVLGSMFAAAVRVPDRGVLPEGLADSKHLTAEERRQFDATIRETAGVAIGVAEIPVGRIDDPDTDMNTLTVAGQADALAAVAREGDLVRCDAADVDARRFGRRMADAVDAAGALDVRAEHRADDRYDCVSAASVVAKVARDAHVDELATAYGPLGSGYPGDPATRDFLTSYVGEHGGLPDCARASWATSEAVLAAAEQSALAEF